jgi:hypothetical protein
MYSTHVLTLYSERPKFKPKNYDIYPYKITSTPQPKIKHEHIIDNEISNNIIENNSKTNYIDKIFSKPKPLIMLEPPKNFYNIPKQNKNLDYGYKMKQPPNYNYYDSEKYIPIITFSDNNGYPNVHLLQLHNINNDYYNNNQNIIPSFFPGYSTTLNIENFSEGIQYLINTGKNFIIYLFGTKGFDGKSWCSECNYVEPFIEQCKRIVALKEREKEIYFINITVEKNNRIPYMIDPNIRLNFIPTLIYFENGKEIKRLVEKQLFSIYNINNFIMSIY